MNVIYLDCNFQKDSLMSGVVQQAINITNKNHNHDKYVNTALCFNKNGFDRAIKESGFDYDAKDVWLSSTRHPIKYPCLVMFYEHMENPVIGYIDIEYNLEEIFKKEAQDLEFYKVNDSNKYYLKVIEQDFIFVDKNNIEIKKINLKRPQK